MNGVEIIILVAVGVAVFFAVRYIVLQHKRHGCVGCSMSNQCGHSWKNCQNPKRDK